MQKRIRKAVIPAAGYGTRFLPVTKAIPKEMIPIVDKPVIQYIVEEALQSGIEEILIITGHGKRQTSYPSTYGNGYLLAIYHPKSEGSNDGAYISEVTCFHSILI